MFPFVRPLNIHPPLFSPSGFCVCYEVVLDGNSSITYKGCDVDGNLDDTWRTEFGGPEETTLYLCIQEGANTYYFPEGDGSVYFYSQTCSPCGPTTTPPPSGTTTPPPSGTTTPPPSGTTTPPPSGTTTPPPSGTTTPPLSGTTTTTSFPTSPPFFF